MAIPQAARSHTTLRFRDPALEAEFIAEHAAKSQRKMRVSAAFTLSLYVIALMWLPSGFAAWSRHLVLGLIIPAFAAKFLLAPYLRTARSQQAVSAAGNLIVGVLCPLIIDDLGAFDRYAMPAEVAIIMFAFVGVGLLWVASLPTVVASALWFVALDFYRGVRLLVVEALVFFAGVAGSAIAAYFVESATRDAFAAERALADEMAKSERLLLNILPPTVAIRLKENPAAIAERFPEATVLFADIVGFTPLSASMPPEELVKLLDAIFSEFDGLAQRHGLEKIKTIGDAYMAAAGIPEPRPDHAEAVVEMALGMQVALARWPELKLRIGIHSGPVVAGVIGQRKFAYDLWGDTVNTASRMESHGVPGAIQVSATVRDALAERFRFGSARTIEVKGKGSMQVWLLEGRPHEAERQPRVAKAT